jgi:hypothetical protein
MKFKSDFDIFLIASVSNIKHGARMTFNFNTISVLTISLWQILPSSTLKSVMEATGNGNTMIEIEIKGFVVNSRS